ncbi:MAG TPA: hypothetical protein VK419_11610 [Bryobacteraceae bacterium]|nr:hypothetical protein [Bryobacteraceae bacterium]
MIRALVLLLFPALASAADCSPDAAGEQQILSAMTENARNYAQALPNFLATRVTKRFLDPSGSGYRWRMVDTIEEHLSYFEHKETYRTVSVNGKPAAPGLQPGLSTGGEFGSVLEDIFSPKTQADFKWKRCQTMHGTPMYVFEYRETKAKGVISFSMSQPAPRTTSMSELEGNQQVQVSVPYHGLIYADRQTQKVMRLTIVSEMPKNFPMREAVREIDYGWTPVGGGEYLLPQKVDVHARFRFTSMHNETEFLLYRKFEADSVLKFDQK